MFATAHSARSSTSRSGVGAYSQIRVATGVSEGSPHRLVVMLFDGFFEALARARGAMRAGEIEAKGKAIGHAARIVDEGLKAALDMTAGQISNDLSDLYAYITVRLMHANLRNDESALDECAALMEPIRSAWNDIGDQVNHITR